MKKSIVFTVIVFFIMNSSIHVLTAAPQEVTVNFEMVKKGIAWLEFINTGAEPEAIKNYFMTRIATTAGCKSIIRHWARFKTWNNELLYKFIAQALGLSPMDGPLKNKDGSLTYRGIRKTLWTNALKKTAQMKKNLEILENKNLKQKAVDLALKNLPPGSSLKANFYFVLFGHSTAFSVGDENGFDFLQLSLDGKGAPDIDHLVLVLAHELHHTGFVSLTNVHMKEVRNQTQLALVGTLVAEGMPTYLIDRPFEKLNEKSNSSNPSYRLEARDWKKHWARLNELYKEAQDDIRDNLAGKIKEEALFARWLSGAKGTVYVLGSHMLSVIDKNLGRKAVLDLARDYRPLLREYNKAAKLANKKGSTFFIFDPALVEQVASFK